MVSTQGTTGKTNANKRTIYQIKDDARESVRESKLAQAMQRKYR
jgi:hypothetical protein